MEYTKRTFTHEDLLNLPYLLIQTGARYTVHGQRLLALDLGGDILCKDYDRGIEYLFPGCKLKENIIKHRELSSHGKESFSHKGIINWKIWEDWAEKLNLEF